MACRGAPPPCCHHAATNRRGDVRFIRPRAGGRPDKRPQASRRAPVGKGWGQRGSRGWAGHPNCSSHTRDAAVERLRRCVRGASLCSIQACTLKQCRLLRRLNFELEYANIQVHILCVYLCCQGAAAAGRISGLVGLQPRAARAKRAPPCDGHRGLLHPFLISAGQGAGSAAAAGVGKLEMPPLDRAAFPL